MTKRNAWPAELDAVEPTHLQAKTRESTTRAPWCHATAWIRNGPLTPVGVNFLAPLLVHTPDVIRTVAVTMDLEPTEIAIERMLTEKTNDEAEASRAAKMNRTVDPRDIAAHGRLDQRVKISASGAAGVNLVGYITVSSRSPEALARDKRTIRASAGKSYLKLEWCDRRAPPGLREHPAVRDRHPPLAPPAPARGTRTAEEAADPPAGQRPTAGSTRTRHPRRQTHPTTDPPTDGHSHRRTQPPTDTAGGAPPRNTTRAAWTRQRRR